MEQVVLAVVQVVDACVPYKPKCWIAPVTSTLASNFVGILVVISVTAPYELPCRCAKQYGYFPIRAPTVLDSLGQHVDCREAVRTDASIGNRSATSAICLMAPPQ
jgi:hypothetical protein